MFDFLAETISTRSFSSLWYWIAVAAVWGHTLRQVMGVPQDVIARAQAGGAALDMLETLAQIQALRLMQTWQRRQVAMVAAAAALLGAITVLAFGYHIELAQALWFVAVPMLLIRALSLRAAQQILADKGQGQAMLLMLQNMRFYRQGIGTISIFVNMIFAMVHVLLQFNV